MSVCASAHAHSLFCARFAQPLSFVGACEKCSRRGTALLLLGLCPKVKNEWNRWKNHFHEMKGDVGSHEKERKQDDIYTKTESHS